jgi:shikimate dehydrogenase
MDKYFVLGNPISHSQSPRIHGLFAAQTGEHLRYERLLVRPDGLEVVLKDLSAKGAKGCNITVPFKEQAYALCQQRTPRAKWAQAGNTISFAGAQMIIDNTDGVGLVRDIAQNAGVALADKRILLMGAGGAASGAVAALLDAGPAALVIANRTSERAVRLVASHRAYAKQVVPLARLEAATLHDLPQLGSFDVIINATSSSLEGEPLHLMPSLLAPGALVYDMMYGAAAQDFLQAASALGANTRDGLGMLVEQAAEAFYFWRGVKPQTAPVLATLRAEMKR